MAAEIELMTDLKPEHKKKCEKCEHDKFHVFDDYEGNNTTDVVCANCGELAMNWL